MEKTDEKDGPAMRICVFGASSEKLRGEYYDEARALGALIGAQGHTLVYGGGLGGLMGACAAGVLEQGEALVGVAPRFFDEGEVLLKERGEFRFTDTMAERKALMESLADAFVVLPGGTGTFEEFFEVFTLAQLGRLSKPIVLLNTLGYYDALLKLLRGAVGEGFVSASCLDLIALASTPGEALSLALSPRAHSARSIADYGK